MPPFSVDCFYTCIRVVLWQHYHKRCLKVHAEDIPFGWRLKKIETRSIVFSSLIIVQFCKIRSLPGYSLASRYTTDRLQVSLRTVTSCHGVLPSARFITTHYVSHFRFDCCCRFYTAFTLCSRRSQQPRFRQP